MNGKYRAKKHRRDLLRRVSGQESTCAGKARYPDRAEAEAGMKATMSRPGYYERPGAALSTYRCVACGHFHFGHAPLAGKMKGRRKSA